MGEVPVWWVWPPPWALGVGLVLVLAGVVWLSAAVVVVHYFALFCVLSCAGKFRCVPVPALACCAASMRRGGRGYPGRATLPIGAECG